MKLLILCYFLFFSAAHAHNPNWERGTEVSSSRENIYKLPPAAFLESVMEGRKHALFYPVSVSELQLPFEPLKTFFESDEVDPIRKLLYQLTKVVSPFKSMEEVYSWLGLHDYPHEIQKENPNPWPRLERSQMVHPMGATFFDSSDGTGLTFGCAACHTGDLFGVKVLGLTNRFPRANALFRQGATLAPFVNSFVFQSALKATEGERKIFVRAKNNLKYVGTKVPVSIGLDTSLAQVALSLSKRKNDPYATKTALSYRFPRPNKLSSMVADSKPAVWWNLKYKNRWLSDGSIVAGNPIYTNFLWNEIGRGTDLVKLEKWLKDNQKTIRELTAAVFASKSPRYEDFFGVHSIDIEKARRGQKHFINSCARCHGQYQKGWELPNRNSLTAKELIQTTKVIYHKLTPVIDVGTDPGRYLGMNEFAEDLNRLAISKSIGTVVEPQKGYVPPPLDGIWARWPYFHNNSIPNLCALLTPGHLRPKAYYAGPAHDKQTDFDQDCVGYPLGNKTPHSWMKDPDFYYNSSKEGLSNLGHDEKIFLKDGKEIYSWSQKLELIEFLKTL